MTIIEALEDPLLFRPLFKDPATWQAWRVWLKAVFTLPMAQEEVELYRQRTGREKVPEAEAKEVCPHRGEIVRLKAIVSDF